MLIPPVWRGPPPVRYPVRPGLWLGIHCGGLAVASALVLLGWATWGVQPPHTLAAVGLGFGAWVGAALLAWRAWRGHLRGHLGWDGQAWAWWGAAAQGPQALQHPPRITWDAQRWVWVCIEPAPGQRHWCLLEQAAAPAAWTALRRALYFRPNPAAAPPQGGPPSGTS